ncbi:unnamed protein product [Hydatigera taeniaeformis]|uniref:DNA-directed RNA polymerase I subunit RPA43 n=1 Tax=Hydatigena taeniaeformis TaxID=6205 RepID=A0A0R3WL08_HYDTA|nr:unnamed protein product [Hydatigera taeniaeformis]
MTEVQWLLSLNLNPLQLSAPRRALYFYVRSQLNKYVPDLRGILIGINKRSEAIHPSPGLATPRDDGAHCIIRFLPEYPFARVNFSVNATVFRASVGLRLNAMVNAVKPQRIICRYEDTFSFNIIIPLQGEDAEPLPNEAESGDPVSIFPRDLVQVELSRVVCPPIGHGMHLWGRILSVLERGNLAKKVLGLPFDNEVEETETASHLQVKKSKKRTLGETEAQEEMTPVKKKKRSKLLEGNYAGENEGCSVRLNKTEQLQETSELVIQRNATSEKAARKRKSRNHEVAENPVQAVEDEAGLELIHDSLDQLSPDLATLSKHTKAEKHVTVEGEVVDLHGVVRCESVSVSAQNTSKKPQTITRKRAKKLVHLKVDPDSALAPSVNRRTSSESTLNEAVSMVEAEDEEEAETPVARKRPATSVRLQVDPKESLQQHWYLVRKLEQSPDISTSSEEEEEEEGADVATVVTRG